MENSRRDGSALLSFPNCLEAEGKETLHTGALAPEDRGCLHPPPCLRVPPPSAHRPASVPLSLCACLNACLLAVHSKQLVGLLSGKGTKAAPWCFPALGGWGGASPSRSLAQCRECRGQCHCHHGWSKSTSWGHQDGGPSAFATTLHQGEVLTPNLKTTALTCQSLLLPLSSMKGLMTVSSLIML